MINKDNKMNAPKDLEDKDCKRCHTIWCMVCCCFFLCNICDEDAKDKKEKNVEMTQRL